MEDTGRMDIHDWDALSRKLLIATVAMLLYAGPASVVTLDKFLSEEFDWEGSSGLGEWWPFVIFIWLFAIPLILGIKYWDDDMQLSATWIGLFLMIALVPTLLGILNVIRIGAMLVMLPAVALPFQWLSLPSPGEDVAIIVSLVITWIVFAAFPLGALIVQVLQIRGAPDR
jgi:hypothetical protein